MRSSLGREYGGFFDVNVDVVNDSGDRGFIAVGAAMLYSCNIIIVGFFFLLGLRGWGCDKGGGEEGGEREKSRREILVTIATHPALTPVAPPKPPSLFPPPCLLVFIVPNHSLRALDRILEL